MKFIETLVVCPETQLLEELLQSWKPRKIRQFGLDVYRVEILEDLIGMFYLVGRDQEYSPELLDHLQSHLQWLMVITDEKISQLSSRAHKTIEELTARFPGAPLLYALKMEKRNLNYISEPAAKQGFYLRENGCILFWNSAVPQSLRNLWRHLFSFNSSG